MTTNLIAQESQTLAIDSGIIDLFQLVIEEDSSGIPTTSVYFHPGKNSSLSNITFRDYYQSTVSSASPPQQYHLQTYSALPIQFSGIELHSDGAQDRPTITIANVTSFFNTEVNSATGAIFKNEDFIGKKFIHRQTLEKHLGTGSATAAPVELPRRVYLIDRVAGETPVIVTFELSSPMDLEGVILPRRTTQGKYCTWQYRGYYGDTYPTHTNYVSTGTIPIQGKGGCTWRPAFTNYDYPNGFNYSSTANSKREFRPYFTVDDNPLVLLDYLTSNGSVYSTGGTTHFGEEWNNSTTYTQTSYVKKTVGSSVRYYLSKSASNQNKDPAASILGDPNWDRVYPYTIWEDDTDNSTSYQTGTSYVEHSYTVWQCQIDHTKDSSDSDKTPSNSSFYWTRGDVCGKLLTSCRKRFGAMIASNQTYVISSGNTDGTVAPPTGTPVYYSTTQINTGDPFFVDSAGQAGSNLRQTDSYSSSSTGLALHTSGAALTKTHSINGFTVERYDASKARFTKTNANYDYWIHAFGELHEIGVKARDTDTYTKLYSHVGNTNNVGGSYNIVPIFADGASTHDNGATSTTSSSEWIILANMRSSYVFEPKMWGFKFTTGSTGFNASLTQTDDASVQIFGTSQLYSTNSTNYGFDKRKIRLYADNHGTVSGNKVSCNGVLALPEKKGNRTTGLIRFFLWCLVPSGPSGSVNQDLRMKVATLTRLFVDDGTNGSPGNGFAWEFLKVGNWPVLIYDKATGTSDNTSAGLHIEFLKITGRSANHINSTINNGIYNANLFSAGLINTQVFSQASTGYNVCVAFDGTDRLLIYNGNGKMRILQFEKLTYYSDPANSGGSPSVFQHHTSSNPPAITAYGTIFDISIPTGTVQKLDYNAKQETFYAIVETAANTTSIYRIPTFGTHIFGIFLSTSQSTSSSVVSTFNNNIGNFATTGSLVVSTRTSTGAVNLTTVAHSGLDGNSSYANWRGFSTNAAIAAGQNLVNYVVGPNTATAGENLTTSITYYIKQTGEINTNSATGKLVGTAVSATTISLVDYSGSSTTATTGVSNSVANTGLGGASAISSIINQYPAIPFSGFPAMNKFK